MQINKLNLNGTNFKSTQKQEKEENKSTGERNIEKNSDINSVPAEYGMALVIKKPVLEQFNPDILEDKSLDEEFDTDELKPQSGGVDLTDIFYLASSINAEDIRHFLNTGEFTEGKKYNVLVYYNNLSPDEEQQVLEEEKIKYANEIKDRILSANEQMNLVSPSKREHTVYRAVKPGLNPEYFDKLKSLKEDEKFSFSPTTVYVSSSGKKVIKNYGGNKDCILFKISLPEGSKLLRFPSNDGIEQLLMKPDAKFKVTENKEYKDNFYLINLDYLPEEE